MAGGDINLVNLVKRFDEATDWLAMKEHTPQVRVIKRQRIPRLPRSLFGPEYYMQQIIANAKAVATHYNLLNRLINKGKYPLRHAA